MKVGFVAGDNVQSRALPQLLRAGLCFDRRAECNADSCFNFQPDADITHTEPGNPVGRALGPRRPPEVGRGRADSLKPPGLNWVTDT